MEYTQYQFWCKTNFTLDQTPPPLRPPQPPPYWASPILLFLILPLPMSKLPRTLLPPLQTNQKKKVKFNWQNFVTWAFYWPIVLNLIFSTSMRKANLSGHILAIQNTFFPFNTLQILIWRAVYFSSTCSLL